MAERAGALGKDDGAVEDASVTSSPAGEAAAAAEEAELAGGAASPGGSPNGEVAVTAETGGAAHVAVIPVGGGTTSLTADTRQPTTERFIAATGAALPRAGGAVPNEALPPMAQAAQMTRTSNAPIPYSYVAGKVIDSNNNPVAGATVVLRGLEFVTQNDGTFFFDKVAPGAATVRVVKGGRQLDHQVELLEGGYPEITLMLRAQRQVVVKTSQGIRGELLPSFGDATYATVSPDGKTIAVETRTDTTRRYDIWLFDQEGVKLSELVSTPGDDSNPRWSPDGKKVAFHTLTKATYSVRVVDVETGHVTEIDQPAMTPAWSPDGKFLVYSKKDTGEWQIVRRDLTNGATTALTDASYKSQYPHWGTLKGNQRIVFASRRAGPFEIWSMDPNGESPERLTTLGETKDTRLVGPTIGPDGSTIAFWEIGRQDRAHNVWVMNVGGGAPERLLDNAANPEWARDEAGNTILYFDSKATGTSQIWRTKLSGM
jgi:Tol biopolymer transport system component